MVQTWASVEKEIEGIVSEEGFFQDLEGDSPLSVERVSTGLYLVDHILGGGMPRGRIVEVSGPEASGKTTFVTQMCAHLQRSMKARCVYFDFEHSYDLTYAQDGLGLNLHKPDFLFSQPSTMEQGFMALQKLIAADACDVVVWDTVAASRPLEELTRPLDASAKIAVHAAHFSESIYKLAGPIRKSKLVVIFVNQLRDVITDYGAGGEKSPGGRALKYYAAVRLDVRRKGDMENRKTEDVFLGTNRQEAYRMPVRFRTIKNKTARPFKEVIVPLVLGHGYDSVGSVVDLALKRKIIEQFGGGNYVIPGGEKVRGYDNLVSVYADMGRLEGLFEQLRGSVGNAESECDAEAGNGNAGPGTGGDPEASSTAAGSDGGGADG